MPPADQPSGVAEPRLAHLVCDAMEANPHLTWSAVARRILGPGATADEVKRASGGGRQEAYRRRLRGEAPEPQEPVWNEPDPARPAPPPQRAPPPPEPPPEPRPYAATPPPAAGPAEPQAEAPAAPAPPAWRPPAGRRAPDEPDDQAGRDLPEWVGALVDGAAPEMLRWVEGRLLVALGRADGSAVGSLAKATLEVRAARENRGGAVDGLDPVLDADPRRALEELARLGTEAAGLLSGGARSPATEAPRTPQGREAAPPDEGGEP